MHELDFRLNEIAARNHRMLTRAAVLESGGTDQLIEDRLRRGQWTCVHPGVYLVGIDALTWNERLAAAHLSAGDGSMASRRAALLLWRLDGITGAPVELNVPFGKRPVPTGSIVHRIRRIERASIIDGIPVTCVEQTLLESAVHVPPVVTEKAFASAWRRNLIAREVFALPRAPRRQGSARDDAAPGGGRHLRRIGSATRERRRGGVPPGAPGRGHRRTPSDSSRSSSAAAPRPPSTSRGSSGASSWSS